MTRRARLLLAATLVAGGFGVAQPASAVCYPVMFFVTGYCNPCYVVGTVVPVTCLD